MTAIFQNRAVPLNKKFFLENYVQYVAVWLVRIWMYKNVDKQERTFSWRKKTYKKRILCKSTLSKQYSKPECT